MAIATTLENYLQEHKINYDIINHIPTYSSMEVARTCHISADRIAKSVIFDDGEQYLMAVVPASCQVSILHLNDLTHGHFSLATEKDGEIVFKDCEPGAYPPIGKAYGLDTVVDDKLWRQNEVYFEAGDHVEMIHLTGEQFHSLLGDVRHGQIGRFRSESHFGQK